MVRWQLADDNLRRLVYLRGNAAAITVVINLLGHDGEAMTDAANHEAQKDILGHVDIFVLIESVGVLQNLAPIDFVMYIPGEALLHKAGMEQLKGSDIFILLLREVKIRLMGM